MINEKQMFIALKPMIFYEGSETYGILCRFWKLSYFREVLKLMIFFEGRKKSMIFYGGSETYGILRWFWNPWYFVEVLKLVVFYGCSKTHGI